MEHTHTATENKIMDYEACIDACMLCASLCNNCASACLQEEDIAHLRNCIQLDMECAAVCYAAAQVMSLQGKTAKEICKVCAIICDACGEECSKHDMAHCQQCAEACKHCAEECRKMAA